MANDVSAISAGSQHTCAVIAGSSVNCWGWNVSGQLGDGSTTDRFLPVQVSGLTSGVSAISAGDLHSCALAATGGVKCWGNNDNGQLGDGTTSRRLAPVDVSSLTGGVIAISAAFSHTCALTSAGGVKCWGWNFYGELGDGSTTSRLTPVDVFGLTSGVSAISAGGFHTCALTTAGGVKCWGWNGYGELGDGSTISRLIPVDVSGLTSGVSAISAGLQHSCAVTTGGGVKCWGGNFYGQLGDGSGATQLTPVDVSGLTSGASAISANSSHHSCALTTAAGVKCWGLNGSGQLGDGSIEFRSTPVDVFSLNNGVSAITSNGGDHSCALTTAGVAMCWGSRQQGQLGTGGRDYRLPGDVMVLPPVALIISIRVLLPAEHSRGNASAYSIHVTNLGNTLAQGVQLSIPVPAGLSNAVWACLALGGCAPATGSQGVSTQFDLGPGAEAIVELSGDVQPSIAFIVLRAQASTSSGGGNSSTSTNSIPANGIGLFRGGFEP